MGSQSIEEHIPFKTTHDNFVVQQQDLTDIFTQTGVHDPEIHVVIQQIEILNDSLVREIFAGSTCEPVKQRQGITQGTIGFLGNRDERIFVRTDPLLVGDVLQV